MSDTTHDEHLSLTRGKPPIAGFWYRVVSFLIDSVILAAPAYLLGFMFFQFAENLGQGGRVFGFIVALLYFGLLDSRIGNGQTIGKRLLQIRVVDHQGQTLSLSRSVLRFLILAVPYFLNGVWFNADTSNPALTTKLAGALLVWIVFGGLGALGYLFVFNRRTRQSLHDLAVGSFVVESTEPVTQIDLPVPRLHRVLVSAWLVLALIVPVVAVFVVPPSQFASLRPLEELRHALGNQLALSQVKVTSGSTHFVMTGGNASTTTFLQVDAQGRGRSREDDDALERSIAGVVLALHPDLLGNMFLVVTVTHGFDLGIVAWHVRYKNSLSAADWQKKLQQVRPQQNKR